jgi:hypothetical protein
MEEQAAFPQGGFLNCDRTFKQRSGHHPSGPMSLKMGKSNWKRQAKKDTVTLSLLLVLTCASTPICLHAAGTSRSDTGQSQGNSAEVNRVIDKYVAAIGGRGAFAKVKTRKMTGESALLPRSFTGPVAVDQKIPNKWSVKEVFLYPMPPPNNRAEMQTGFDGTGLDAPAAGRRIERLGP